MEYTFSNGLRNLQPSAIREILKYAGVPGVVALSAGNPAPEAFPTEAIAEISARLLAERPIDVLQYGATEGYQPLRDHLKTYLREKYAVGNDNDEILITSGAQQVMELVAKTVCNAGDVVICESPSFIGSLNSFRSLGLKLVGVPVEADGMDVDALECALKENTNVRFIYTIPNFQNPAGVTMSMEKRRRVYELAKAYNVLIVEDNPYGDLRFAGEDVPAIKTLDDEGLVVYAGSFSKVLASGLRVGYALAGKPLLAKMIVAKQGEDVHTTQWAQMVCHEFMTKYDFEAHLDRLRAVYNEKAQLMMDLLDEHLVPTGITYHRPEGGLFIWCRLPDGVDMADFCTKAVKEHKVAVVPGSAFNVEGEHLQTFRVNYSTPTNEAMREGVKRLGAFAAEYFK
ncbi:MAG: PLP-dependent aminotransferase family protein [Clostridia bacterium]|nr:PLP-dependent aminotransferase family protein [Clostridia bacterium]